MKTITIDCASCVAKGPGCDSCVMSVLIGAGPRVTFEPCEQRAQGVLEANGLVPKIGFESNLKAV